MYKKAWCTRKVVVLLIKAIVHLTFSLPSASLDLKVPILPCNLLEGSFVVSFRDLTFVIYGGSPSI